MAVFWFGWGKKLKNALTKKQADSLYLPKTTETEINELKRLTTLKSYYETNSSIKINNSTSITLNDLDDSKPIYFAFLRRDSAGTYLDYCSYGVRMKWFDTWLILNENIKVKLRKANNIRYIDFQVNSPSNGDYFTNLSINYTPKTL